LVKSSIDAGSKTRDLSVGLGASTETLSRLQHVAKLSGVEFETLVSGLEKIQRNISQASLGKDKAFGALSINVKKFKKLELDDKMLLLTGAFQKFNIEMFNEANKLGLTLNQMDANALDDAGYAIDILGSAITGLGYAFTIALTPAIK